MCGIVGLFAKTREFECALGAHLAQMLMQMTERGPDSAGFAVYRDDVGAGAAKVTVMLPGGDFDTGSLEAAMTERFGAGAGLVVRATHAVLTVPADAKEVLAWLQRTHSELYVTSSGSVIEIYKETGLPKKVVSLFGLDSMTASHALGHTRMATESAVTSRASHPFSTGLDVCLVHNGSLSNHNRLRENLRDEGIRFGTDNDSEVAAGYLQWRMSRGDDLDDALNHVLEDLDGFYTFAIGTRDGFAVLRDPIGCKPAVMAETDDWVAMATEFRAIATLPGVDNARLSEPEPGRVYTWERGRCDA